MDMLINGKHISADDLAEVKNPYNGEVIDTVPVSHLNNVDLAIDAAVNAKDSIQEMSAFKISNKLYAVYEKLKDNKDELAELLTKEVGKPINESVVEVNRSIETLKLSAEEAKRIYGETVPLDGGINGKGFFAFTQRVPLGVVAAITPFNYPLNLSIHKIAPAIACKNTVIIKPPINAPLTVMKFAELVNEEFPDGVINTVTGYGSEVGDALVTSPEVDKISFTGSVATGLLIASRAGMKKVTLELGGNDPLVVLKDADLDRAVNGVMNGAYLNAGQVCMGVKRIIVDESIADEFTQKLVRETKKIKMGDPMDKNTVLGTLIDEDAARMVEETVNNAVKAGAKILTGGKRDGAFYEATVLDNVSPDMDVVVNETFGPVAPIIKVKSIDEAIKVANDTEYGLQAGVFTENFRDGLRCANEIEAGTVFVNKQSTFRTDNMPFGGFKNSGTGKEGVKYAVEEMTKINRIKFKIVYFKNASTRLRVSLRESIGIPFGISPSSPSTSFKIFPSIPRNIPSLVVSINDCGGSNETPTLFPSFTFKSFVTTVMALFPKLTLHIIKESALGCFVTLIISPTFISIPIIGSLMGPRAKRSLRPKTESMKNLTLATFSIVFSLSSLGALLMKVLFHPSPPKHSTIFSPFSIIDATFGELTKSSPSR